MVVTVGRFCAALALRSSGRAILLCFQLMARSVQNKRLRTMQRDARMATAAGATKRLSPVGALNWVLTAHQKWIHTPPFLLYSAYETTGRPFSSSRVIPPCQPRLPSVVLSPPIYRSLRGTASVPRAQGMLGPSKALPSQYFQDPLLSIFV